MKKKDTEGTKHLAADIKLALEKLGYHWEIEHVRPMHNFTVVKNVEDEHGEHVEYDNCLSRDEFNDAVENLQYVAPADCPKKYGCFVETTGGFTRVFLTKRGDAPIVGKHNFKPKDNFHKNLGFVKAVYKCIGKEITPVIDEIIEERKRCVAEFNNLNKD